MLRNISKPFKRWAFNRAKIYTFNYIKIYNKKYIIKYLNKRKKIETKKNNIKLLNLIDKLNTEELLTKIEKNKTNDFANIINIINTYLLNNSKITEIYDYNLIIDLTNYIIELNNINKKDIGLDHAKVREYWLKRGPRIFITSILLVSFNYILHISFKETDYNTNIYLILINMIALLLSFYMLYYRLPDSIESAIARTTHDYYVKTKKNLIII
jgi:hypothetical protein